MPRDNAGNYSLAAGNPVVAGTTIESVWANSTMDDLANAMTDSLSRSGSGGMLAPFFFVDGVISAPGMAWSQEPNTGFYRAGAGDMRASLLGADITRWNNGMFSVWDGAAWAAVVIQGGVGSVPDGTADAQTLSWDETGGLGWLPVPGPTVVPGATADGNMLRWEQDTSQWQETNALRVNDSDDVVIGNHALAPDGAATAPSWAFNSAPTTGWFSPGAAIQAWSLVGAEAMRLDASGLAVVGTVNTRDIAADGTQLDTNTVDIGVNSGNIVTVAGALTTHESTLPIHTPLTGATAMVALNQAAYDLLAPPDPDTLYFVTPT